jgi:hypothetical protein
MNKGLLIAVCLLLLSNLAVPAQAQDARRVSKSMMLPPTKLDSFVHHAVLAGHGEHIYGDEGVYGPPPYMGFNVVHRINTGIIAERDEGLTTGHGSYLPDAWGSDEFLRAPGAWSQSGANYGDHEHNGVDGNCDGEPGSSGWGDDSGHSHGGGGGASGGRTPVTPPYKIGSNWIAVNNTHNGQIMGWMAPGESFEDFFSGRSGHLLPGWEAEGRYILEHQLPLLRGGK